MRQRRLALLLPLFAFGGLMFLFVPMPVQAGAVINVTTVEDKLNADGDCSLREAFLAANTDAAVDACPAGNGDDTIQLAAAQYTIALTGTGDLTSGDWDITSTLTLRGVTSATTILDGAELDRVLHVHAGANALVMNLTLTHGRSPLGAPTGCGEAQNAPCPGAPGGGLLNEGTLEMMTVVVAGNRTADSPDCGWTYENPVNCARMSDAGSGGGIANQGVMTLSLAVINDNRGGNGGNCAWGQGQDCRGGDGGQGGGVFNQGTLTLMHSFVESNRAGGGGMNLMSGHPYVASITGMGGGLYNAGMLTLVHTTVRANRAADGPYVDWPSSAYCCPLGPPDGDGGGIYNRGTLQVQGSTLAANVTGGGGAHTGGGGGLANDGTAVLEQSAVHDNHTSDGATCHMRYCRSGDGGSGAGILNRAVLTVTNCSILRNVTGDGGPANYLYAGCGGSGGDGAGIVNSGSLWSAFTTISGNRTGVANSPSEYCQLRDGMGGGLRNDGAVTLYNTILALNQSAAPEIDCAGTLTVTAHSLIHNPTGCTFPAGLAGSLVGFDPRFAGFSAPDAPTLAVLVQPASPAIDAGSCTIWAGQVITSDQLGARRPQRATCDIGAVESPYTSTFVVYTVALPHIVGAQLFTSTRELMPNGR